jgi:hypothetical protein
MRIYLSMIEPNDKSCVWISDIATFESQVLDGEATYIVLNRFLSAFTHAEIQPLLEKIVKKMRLNCELVVIENDMDFIAKKLVRDEINIGEVNDILFRNTFIKSVCTLENIEKNLPNSIQLQHKHFDNLLSEITIKCRRLA